MMSDLGGAAGSAARARSRLGTPRRAGASPLRAHARELGLVQEGGLSASPLLTVADLQRLAAASSARSSSPAATHHAPLGAGGDGARTHAAGAGAWMWGMPPAASTIVKAAQDGAGFLKYAVASATAAASTAAAARTDRARGDQAGQPCAYAYLPAGEDQHVKNWSEHVKLELVRVVKDVVKSIEDSTNALSEYGIPLALLDYQVEVVRRLRLGNALDFHSVTLEKLLLLEQPQAGVALSGVALASFVPKAAVPSDIGKLVERLKERAALERYVEITARNGPCATLLMSKSHVWARLRRFARDGVKHNWNGGAHGHQTHASPHPHLAHSSELPSDAEILAHVFCTHLNRLLERKAAAASGGPFEFSRRHFVDDDEDGSDGSRVRTCALRLHVASGASAHFYVSYVASSGMLRICECAPGSDNVFSAIAVFARLSREDSHRDQLLSVEPELASFLLKMAPAQQVPDSHHAGGSARR